MFAFLNHFTIDLLFIPKYVKVAHFPFCFVLELLGSGLQFWHTIFCGQQFVL
jgi:hypothetical protein